MDEALRTLGERIVAAARLATAMQLASSFGLESMKQEEAASGAGSRASTETASRPPGQWRGRPSTVAEGRGG